VSPRKRPTSTRTRGRRRSRSRGPEWADWPDEDLESLRICDLGLRLEGTPLEERVQRLYDELEARGFRFRPHCWLSEEWFSPSGVPGIGIPFYLAHPRLMRLERKHMMEVEGGRKEWCMKILRHEAGHALQTAYRLSRRRRWRQAFGKNSQPYPDFYQPRPYSKSYVLHLDLWYAQAHPAEDFAETFAVWLKPRWRWRHQYRGWRALRKLEYVDELMQEIRQRKPQVVSRRHVDSVRTMRTTLGEHYEDKRRRHGLDRPDFYDQDLKRLFSEDPGQPAAESAADFLERMRPALRKRVAQWTGQYQYMIDQVLEEMIERSEELDLYRDRPEREAKQDALVMLTVQTLNYLHGGHHRIAL
jgi:hypothetical protein